MRPKATDYETLVERILARAPSQFERVQPIDERQIELTERWIVPALPLLEGEFLEIRAEVDEELRGHLVDHPDRRSEATPVSIPRATACRSPEPPCGSSLPADEREDRRKHCRRSSPSANRAAMSDGSGASCGTGTSRTPCSPAPTT